MLLVKPFVMYQVVHETQCWHGLKKKTMNWELNHLRILICNIQNYFKIPIKSFQTSLSTHTKNNHDYIIKARTLMSPNNLCVAFQEFIRISMCEVQFSKRSTHPSPIHLCVMCWDWKLWDSGNKTWSHSLTFSTFAMFFNTLIMAIKMTNFKSTRCILEGKPGTAVTFPS